MIVRWTISSNPPFYKADKTSLSIFANANEVEEFLEEMYERHDGFMALEIKEDL